MGKKGISKYKQISPGDKFDRLTAITAIDSNPPGWLFRCDCGRQTRIATSYISKARKSCGQCLQRNSKPLCKKGHQLEEFGRDKNGGCRACIRERNLIANYGITLADYRALWKAQDGKCAICRRPISIEPPGSPGWHEGTRIEVDHKHGTKLPKRQTVRGLLCGGRWAGCNRKLGRFDNPVWLKAALEYVLNPPAHIILNPIVPVENAA